MQPETKQEPYFHMKTDEASKDLSTSAAGGYVGEDRSMTPTLAALFMLIGGIMAVAGALMVWFTVSVEPVELPKQLANSGFDTDILAVSFKGTSDFFGWLLVLNGAVGAILGGTYFLSEQRNTGDTRELKKGLIPVLFLVGFTVWLWFSYSGTINDLKDVGTRFGLGDQAAATLSAAIETAYGPGFWLSVLGALLLVLGVVFAFMASAPKVTAIAPGGSKWSGPPPASPRPGGSQRA